MDLSLTGRHALVGGASKGIGRASAEELALNGATVTVMARSADLLNDVRAQLPTPSGQAHQVLVGDTSDHEAMIHSVENHVKNVGAIHIVVNNTGGPPGGPLVESSVEELIQAFHNHVLAAHQLMRVVIPTMRSEGYGRFINIISTSVKQPIEGLGVSNTTRGAMASWAKTLANEVAQDGITVNNVLPGATETERLTGIISRKSDKTGRSEDAVREEMLAEIPAHRFGTAAEIANAVGFLASPAAAYINGTSIIVDGGRTRTLS